MEECKKEERKDGENDNKGGKDEVRKKKKTEWKEK